MSRNASEIWIHALGAKVGGGLTYLRAVLPELARQLEGRVEKVVVLLPAQIADLDRPSWFEHRVLESAAASWTRRTIFDQVVLPVWMAGSRRRALFCTGSFSPVIGTAPTVALLRNAVYFDEAFLAMDLPDRSRSYRLQGALIGAGARRCTAVMYPSQAMRELVESKVPSIADSGFVNHYGVADEFFSVRPRCGEVGEDRVVTFLYVMNYTLQKNVRYLLEALAIAKTRGLRVRVVITSRLDDGHPLDQARDRAFIDQHALEEAGYLELAGPKHGGELLDLYANVDACVFPSLCESFGNPLVEAMAAGKPLICADRPYAREICGDAAMYVDPENPEDLADLWGGWQERLSSWRPSDRAAVAERFSWPGHVTRLIDALLN